MVITLLAAETAATGFDGSDLWGMVSFVAVAISTTVGFVTWMLKHGGSLTWKRATDLQAAALSALSETKNEDVVVAAAAHLQRRVVLDKIVAKQSPLILPWFFTAFAVILLVLSLLTGFEFGIGLGWMYLGVGLLLAMFTARERRRLRVIYTPTSPLSTSQERRTIARARARALRNARKPVKRSLFVDILETH